MSNVMQSNATECPSRPAGLPPAGCWWHCLKHYVLKVGFLAALCALFASTAHASFSGVEYSPWYGGSDYFYGNTWISHSTTLTNSGALSYNTSALPADTGDLTASSGNYYYGVGLLDDGSDGAAIINESGATIQGIVTGSGQGIAAGIYTIQNVTVNNSGTINAEFQDNDGDAYGVYQNSGFLALTNNAGATISAIGAYDVAGVQAGQLASIVNNGTITATATGGVQGDTANQCNSDAVDMFAYCTDGSCALYLENNGTLVSYATGGTSVTNSGRPAAEWGEGSPVTFRNTGLVTTGMTPGSHGEVDCSYIGADNADVSFYNSGTFSETNNGVCVWLEQDSDVGDMRIDNSGIIYSSQTWAIELGMYNDGNSSGHCYVTNTGPITGGWMGLGWNVSGGMTFYDSGDVNVTLNWLGGNADVHVFGLPTWGPAINNYGGWCSNLVFNLIGTLQKVNGSAASGTNLSAFNLGSSGSIVVSGKSYGWNNFSHVSGAVSAMGGVPPPWQQRDMGSVGVAGGAVYEGGMFALLASGNDIGSTTDAFHFVYQPVGTNCAIIARVSAEGTTSANAKGGVMVRDSLNANAANAFIGVMPGNRLVFQFRSSDGGGSSSNSVTGLGASYWVKLAQSGNVLMGYYSVDGANWTQLGTATNRMGFTNYAGLAYCNNNNSRSGTVTFYSATCAGSLFVPSAPTGLTAIAGVERVTLNWLAASNAADYDIGRSTSSGGPYVTVGSTSGTNYIDADLPGRTTYYYVVTTENIGGQGENSVQVSATPAANVPPPWTAQDIGPVKINGSESYTNGVFTVTASGNVTASALDAFRFVYATNSGNCLLVARVSSQQNTDPWSEAGLMIRDSLDASAANVFIGTTPSNGVAWEYRPTGGALGSVANNVTNLAVPCWVALTQNDSTFTGYYSTNGEIWTALGTTTVSMKGTEYVGLAVCSHSGLKICTAMFDHVSAPGSTLSFAATNFTWSAPVSITTAEATLASPAGQALAGAATFGGTAYTVALTNGARINFTSDGSVATATGTGTATGAFNGNTGNANFNAVLNEFNYDSGPKTITLNNLKPGAFYTVRFFGLDDRSPENLRQAYLTDPKVIIDVSPTWQMGGNSYVTGTFTALSSTETFIEQLPGDSSGDAVNSGNANALVLWMTVPGPTGLIATPVSTSQINLAWSALSNATSYAVMRSLTNGGPYTVVAGGITLTNYNDTGLAGGTMYYYVVNAVAGANETANSAQASAATVSPAYGPLFHRYSFSETNGTTVADSVGGPVWNGTLPNGGTFTNGQLSFSLDANQYLNLPGGILSNYTAATIEMWVPGISGANTSPPAVYLFAIGNTDGSGNGYDYVFFNPNLARTAISAVDPGYHGEQGGNLASSLGLATNLHLTCVFNSPAGTISVYTNGVLASTFTGVTDSLSSVGNQFAYIGRSLYTGDSYLNWTLKELRIYNQALNSAEVAATDSLGPNQLLGTNNPPINVVLTGTILTLSWPLANAGFTLQSCTNLASGGWTNVSNSAPQISNGRWQISLPLGDVSSTFYRVAK